MPKKSTKNQLYKGICGSCNSSFVYRESRIRKRPGNPSIAFVPCPYCRNNILHDATTVDASEIKNAQIFE